MTAIFKDPVLSRENAKYNCVESVSLYKCNWEKIQRNILRRILFWSLQINKHLNVQETDP